MTLLTTIKSELTKKGYDSKTVTLYSSHLIQLSQFYSPKNLNDLTIKELKGYMDYLRDTKKLSSSTRNTAKHAFTFWFGQILNRPFDFNDINVPRVYKRNSIVFFTEEEVLTLISHADTIKNRVFISVAYGCGLELSELRNIKLSDIDLERRRVKVKIVRGRKFRDAIIPYSIIEDIKLYLAEYKPSKWLFEGVKKGEQMAPRSLQHIFIKTFEKTEIQKELSMRSLRYSYIIHLKKKME